MVSNPGGDDEVDRYVAVVAARLADQFAEVSATIRTALEDGIAELPDDPQMIGMLGEAVEQHLAAMLDALRGGVPAASIPVPAVAIEYAQAFPHSGVPPNALVRAYRIAQRRMTEVVRAELHAIDMEPTSRVAVIENITTVLFEYVDRVSQQIVVVYDEERDRLLDSQNSARETLVADLLDDDSVPVDVDTAATTIGYPLRWQHLALIAWEPAADGASDGNVSLQRFIRDLAAAADTATDPLLVTVDASTQWVWLPYRSVPGDIVTKIREFARARREAPNLAIGATGTGAEGFRRSHRQAQRAREVAPIRNDPQRVVIAATDAGVLAPALLGTDLEEVRDWVADVLGALASDTDEDARLRETLLVFLNLGSGYKAASEELNVGTHSVRYSVERAVARRGRPIDNRHDVKLALLVCQWYGAAVLQRPPAVGDVVGET